MHQCDVCSAKVSELRRGRCWGCYARWVDARPVGIGARCLTCGERRRRLLKSVELFGGWPAMCFSCAGQLMTLAPMPRSLPELKIALSRDRRRNDRRLGMPDARVFQFERRIGERRGGKDDYPIIDDEMIIEISVEDDGDPPDFADITRIFGVPA